MFERRYFRLCLLCIGLVLGVFAREVLQLNVSVAQPPNKSAKSTVPYYIGERPPANQPVVGSARQAPDLNGSAGNSTIAPPIQIQQLPAPQSSLGQAAGQNHSGQPDVAFDDDLLPEERVSMAVYDRCNRSVVHIATKSTRMESFLTVTHREGTGSGSVLDVSGTILTNQHVIDGAKEIAVSLYNGVSYPAVLVGQDTDTDIAILKIEAPAEHLEPIAWGDSQRLRVGQRIYAIGNPFGLERSMSTGMIASLNRQIPSREHRMRSLIQIDASLNQGNSGGPLLNTRGELIGMNAAIMSSNGDSAGVGFAIPSSTIQRILGKLLTNGRVIRPTIGITRVYENERGLLIVTVAKGGPADLAGLKGFSLVTKAMRQGLYRYEQNSIDPSTADLIQAIDGGPVKSADELLEVIENRAPGDTVILDIIRSGKAIRVPITLGNSE